jgi:hypothetical protein
MLPQYSRASPRFSFISHIAASSLYFVVTYARWLTISSASVTLYREQIRHTLDVQLILPPQKAHNKADGCELTSRLLAVLTLTHFLAEIFIIRVFRTKHAIIILKMVLKFQAHILFYGRHNKANTQTHSNTHTHITRKISVI